MVEMSQNFDPKTSSAYFSIGRETVNRVAAEGARGVKANCTQRKCLMQSSRVARKQIIDMTSLVIKQRCAQASARALNNSNAKQFSKIFSLSKSRSTDEYMTSPVHQATLRASFS